MKYLSTFNESLFHAVDYYRTIDKKLAIRFFDAVDEAKRQISQFPKIGKLVGGYRVFILRDFPYSFCYREDFEGEIVAVLLFHHKQSGPGIE
jgi:plasmid stabilization system protein ParE